jgi:hypothetical protein
MFNFTKLFIALLFIVSCSGYDQEELTYSGGDTCPCKNTTVAGSHESKKLDTVHSGEYEAQREWAEIYSDTVIDYSNDERIFIFKIECDVKI